MDSAQRYLGNLGVRDRETRTALTSLSRVPQALLESVRATRSLSVHRLDVDDVLREHLLVLHDVLVCNKNATQ